MTADPPSPKPRPIALIVLAVYWVALTGVTLAPTVSTTPPKSLVRLDHMIHVAVFALLYGLVLWARPFASRLGPRAYRLAAAVVVLAYAAADEYAQQFVGRVSALDDMGANVMGVLCVYIVASMPSGLTRFPRFLVSAARAVWLTVVPGLMLLTVMPSGNQLVESLRRSIGMHGHGSDKDGHFYLAMLLTWLLALACPATRNKPRISAAVTLIVMLVSAPMIEWAQLLTRSFSNRTVEAADIVSHYHGTLIAVAVWAGLIAFVAPVWNALLDCFGVPTLAQQHRATLARRFDPSADPRFVGHAALVSGLTLVSRLTGLARDAVLARAFGLGLVADAFTVGFLVPNLFRRLFGEGALTAAFIPHYSDLLRNDPALARRFASLTVALLVVVLSAITIAGQFVLDAMLASGGWDARGALSLRLVMIMLPYMPMICVVALLGGLLQVHRRFGPPAVAPIILNLTIVVFVLWGGAGLRLAEVSAEGTDRQRSIAFLAAGAVLVAGLIQVGYLLIATQRATKLTVHFRGALPTLVKMSRMMVPMVLGLAVFQINALLDVLIAMWLSPGESGAAPASPILGMFAEYPMRLGDIAALGWAQRLYQFPLGVFGIAIATAIFPALSGAVMDHPETGKTEPGENFAATLRQGLRLTVFIGLPASIGLIVVREPLARLVYERGDFTYDDTKRVAAILLGYAGAIWAYSMTHVLTRAYHALKDAKTPLIVSVCMVGFNLALNLVLVWPMGAQGLATSTAITAAIQSAVLIVLIRRRIDTPIDAAVLKSWGRTALASAVMGGAIVVPPLLLPQVMRDPTGGIVMLACLTGGGMLIYFAAAKLMRCEELSWLRRR